MPDLLAYDYAIIRVVPRVEREEFVNVGVVVSCASHKFLGARIELDEQRLMALDSTLDLEVIRDYLAAIPLICVGGEPAGPIGRLPQRDRFHWIVAPRSTVIQTSRVHTGLCPSLPHVIEHLLDTMVRPCKQNKMTAIRTA
ncbi:DUF3037 domain-containing protein [Trichocoleus desertorum AS-A10]|uniref:DUF3037 domain-containing protein n=1 Tax=Trichocoleus desertorum TaxID=1481672 RepID=UPI0032970E93